MKTLIEGYLFIVKSFAFYTAYLIDIWIKSDKTVDHLTGDLIIKELLEISMRVEEMEKHFKEQK